MLTAQVNLWKAYLQGDWVAITTNGVLNSSGEAVMGRGCAWEAKLLLPELPRALGAAIAKTGNHVHVWPEWRIATFPTKHHWRDPSSLPLIKQSAIELKAMADQHRWPRIFIPRPGCGLGRLRWPEVHAALASIWNDDRFIVVSPPPRTPA